MTTQKIKIWKRSHSSLVTIFSMHMYCFIDYLQRQEGGKDRCKTQNSVCKGQINS